MGLAQTQKNELYIVAQAAELDPSTFSPVDYISIWNGYSYPTTRVWCLQTHLYFDVHAYTQERDVQKYKFGGDFYRTVFVQWMERDHLREGEELKWESVRSSFSHWLEKHVTKARQHVHHPELWGRAVAESVSSSPGTLVSPAWRESFSGTPEPEPFSPSEVKKIRAALARFKARVEAEFRPNPAQAAEIAGRIEYLSDKLETVNSFDWLSIAFSIVIGIAINLTVDTAGGQRLWDLFREALAQAGQILP